DIGTHGIFLSGTGARLRNFDKRLYIETNVGVSLVDDPLSCVVVGAARMLKTAKLRPEEKPDEYDLLDSSTRGKTSPITTLLSLFFPSTSRDLAIDMGGANVLV